jgi:hypothetical protein
MGCLIHKELIQPQDGALFSTIASSDAVIGLDLIKDLNSLLDDFSDGTGIHCYNFNQNLTGGGTGTQIDFVHPILLNSGFIYLTSESGPVQGFGRMYSTESFTTDEIILTDATNYFI